MTAVQSAHARDSSLLDSVSRCLGEPASELLRTFMGSLASSSSSSSAAERDLLVSGRGMTWVGGESGNLR